MKSIYDLTLEQLKEELKAMGQKPFRAKQIYEWIYVKNVYDFHQMTNLSKELQETLSNHFSDALLTIKEKQVARDGTTKYLLELEDGGLIETVLMIQTYGRSLCVTSQLGCNMGCSFCASGLLKKQRNLTSGEIVKQVLTVMNDLKERVTHVVVMGTGEPFDNYDNLCNMIKIINDPKGLAIGARHITVSTCGIVPKIKEFADFPYQVNLAISLHAPNDKLRKEIMPIAKAYSLSELMDALNYYIKKTNRRVTFEYILLKDVNDSEENAKELVNLIKGMNAYVNLIPYNATEHLQFSRSNTLNIAKFYDILKKNNICVTIRREFGSKISAACGQLRSKKEEV